MLDAISNTVHTPRIPGNGNVECTCVSQACECWVQTPRNGDRTSCPHRDIIELGLGSRDTDPGAAVGPAFSMLVYKVC